jgi:pimeloyl-ACP methyl ester carboxylesterase
MARIGVGAVTLHPTPDIAYAPVRPGLRRTTAEAIAFLRRSPTLAVDPALPRGHGQPILVLPVIGRGDDHAAPMRAALSQLGYRPFGWGLGTNVGPTPGLIAGVQARLASLHAAHGPLIVIGFSMGGVFARLLAHLHHEKVSQAITVCSPFRRTIDSAFLPLRPLLPAWRTPDLLGLEARFAAPLPVAGTFIFTRADGIVAWESCIEPSKPEDCFEITGMHMTITRDPEVLDIIARRLARALPESRFTLT